ncbi:carbon storage regulator CsrA [Clostridium sp.]|jgi:carbon storage regulator|uniref:carbon storage regulator CsrA n=1 Tax=Clostridium sp. TaxID=1506 RepID=UPI00095B3FA0|nr:carbon storage regulator CsrA [Clostridium sp.]MEE0566543.1 carbon storage regulator CsrA [Clostridium sp.]OKZ78031.1 MAG: carbon storage regulator [Clostridium sp. 27_14]
MLVIRRKKDESILIGENIEVSISAIENGTVKLSINAPKEIQILRKELYIEVQNENKEAVSSNIDVLKKIKIKND